MNHSHVYPDGKVVEHLHCHVYHEGVGKKGAHNVASLLIKIKIMKTMGILREDMVGSELTVVFDNCSGQNKNNTILKLLAQLVEMYYFHKVQFVFLIVGHTKNACGHLFNALKKVYRRENIYTFPALLQKLDASDKVTIYESQEEDFADWDDYLRLFYSNYAKKVKQNHIFSCKSIASRSLSAFLRWDSRHFSVLMALRSSGLLLHLPQRLHWCRRQHQPGLRQYPVGFDAYTNEAAAEDEE